MIFFLLKPNLKLFSTLVSSTWGLFLLACSLHLYLVCDISSPVSSRPETPKSDTEVDRQKSIEGKDILIADEEDDTLWEWGAMPRKSVSEGVGRANVPGRASGDEGLYTLHGLLGSQFTELQIRRVK